MFICCPVDGEKSVFWLLSSFKWENSTSIGWKQYKTTFNFSHTHIKCLKLFLVFFFLHFKRTVNEQTFSVPGATVLLAGEVESLPLQMSVFDSADPEEKRMNVNFFDTGFQTKSM